MQVIVSKTGYFIYIIYYCVCVQVDSMKHLEVIPYLCLFGWPSVLWAEPLLYWNPGSGNPLFEETMLYNDHDDQCTSLYSLK